MNWRQAMLLLTPEAAENGRAWFWRAPLGDSLIILRPSMLSEGLEFRGLWKGDTLRGRAFAFSDNLSPQNPRANVYGVRFECRNHESAERALAAVETLRERDVPNTQLGIREDSQYWAEIQTRFNKVKPRQ